ncbi:hypothetical protein DFH08DRAFT_999673 [Mycena albidolilacea]|uniref:Uncharacterized protein n=1 Tax=Mycena albidolilacea TaxID=1033008 RepID=A0AAD6YW63_9AGAR|nr:hypothetical protein DFH08DRAFT_999673 [Mycena albidolilacea]
MIVTFVTDGILAAAFVLCVAGLSGAEDKAANLRLMSFQVLSFVAPLLWMTLLTVFGGYKSQVFSLLLPSLSLGFGQGLYAFHASDGSTDRPSSDVVDDAEAQYLAFFVNMMSRARYTKTKASCYHFSSDTILHVTPPSPDQRSDIHYYSMAVLEHSILHVPAPSDHSIPSIPHLLSA